MDAGQEDWKWAKIWVAEKKERRLVLVDAPLPPKPHPQVSWKTIDSPLQIEKVAKEIAWEAVFLKMEVLGGKTEASRLFRKELEKAHLAANLLLSDAADWGCFLAKHAYLRRNRPVRDGMQLERAFQKIPALIVGAGPSLEKNGHLLRSFQDRALIFAGGAALHKIQAEPHFAAAVDKEAPTRDFKRHSFAETPFCFQSRMNPGNLTLVHGEAILFPDSHFRFLDEGERFDGGWTVGTFQLSLATLMGCDPIILVGMDYCYKSGRKYAGEEEKDPANLVEAMAADGTKVWTQPDWLLAKAWTEEWAKRHPEHRFFDATEGGIGFSFPIQPIELSKICLEKKMDLREIVHKAVMALPLVPTMDWDRWKKSLEKCGRIASGALFGEEEDFEGERAYETLLEPLWRTWSPVFHRALRWDPHPDKIKINRLLFFQQVIQEHLHAIE
jgi:6-hydroxymethylpterin diphosphokinase MptE-like protein